MNVTNANGCFILITRCYMSIKELNWIFRITLYFSEFITSYPQPHIGCILIASQTHVSCFTWWFTMYCNVLWGVHNALGVPQTEKEWQETFLIPKISRSIAREPIGKKLMSFLEADNFRRQLTLSIVASLFLKIGDRPLVTSSSNDTKVPFAFPFFH